MKEWEEKPVSEEYRKIKARLEGDKRDKEYWRRIKLNQLGLFDWMVEHGYSPRVELVAEWLNTPEGRS